MWLEWEGKLSEVENFKKILCANFKVQIVEQKYLFKWL